MLGELSGVAVWWDGKEVCRNVRRRHTVCEVGGGAEHISKAG